jgi:hypothetical protein
MTPRCPIIHSSYEVMMPGRWWCRCLRVRRTLAGLLEAIYAIAKRWLEQGVGLDLGPKEVFAKRSGKQAVATPARSATQVCSNQP